LPDRTGTINSGETHSGGYLRAFLFAPLGAVAVLSLWGVWVHSTLTGSTDLEDLLSAVVIFTVLSYVAALVLGLPIFLVLRRLQRMSSSSCAIGGCVSGLIFFLIPYSLWYGVSSTLTTRTPEMVASMIAGMAAGVLFWQLRRV
jgi:hypothetical protein